MSLILHPEIKQLFPNPENLFDHFMQLQGDVFRALENRRTQRVILGGNAYFIKQHFGVGWKEILKNLLQRRLPIISAKNEWQAIQRLQQLNIATTELVAFGAEGINPARKRSFILTRELPHFITLEDLCKHWRTHPPAFKLKFNLIQAVAHIAQILHSHGINHRDFYLCHFLLEKKPIMDLSKLYLIDLHRAQLRTKTPLRWIIKDLAGLYFSSKEIGLTHRDLLRFIKKYRGQPLRDVLKNNFWQKVKKRGDKLYQKHT